MMLWMLVGCAGLTVNDVTTGESDAYPELKALWVRTNPGRAFDRAEVVARSLPGWESCVVERPERRPVLHCEASSRTRLFTDDVWIWTEAAGKGMTRVMTRSASRVGKGDFGTNHRRILSFQSAYQAYDASGR